MCIGCAMTAASAATGLRSWLQNHSFGWLTPRRMRMLTLSLMSAAALVSTIGLSGSSASGARSDPHPSANTARTHPATR